MIKTLLKRGPAMDEYYFIERQEQFTISRFRTDTTHLMFTCIERSKCPHHVWILAAASCSPLSLADRPLRFHVCRYVQVPIEVRRLFLMSGCLNVVLHFVRCSLLDFLMRVIAVQIGSL